MYTLPRRSRPYTTLVQHSSAEVQELRARNVSDAINITQYNFSDRELILEALTAAHKDETGVTYASDGYRSLAGSGQTAIISCIRYAKGNGHLNQYLPFWERLKKREDLVHIFETSQLCYCTATSIRQNDRAFKHDLPPKIAILTVRALIGAVWQDSQRCVEVTCQALNSICRFLKSDVTSIAITDQQDMLEPRPQGNQQLATPLASQQPQADMQEVEFRGADTVPVSGDCGLEESMQHMSLVHGSIDGIGILGLMRARRIAVPVKKTRKQGLANEPLSEVISPDATHPEQTGLPTPNSSAASSVRSAEEQRHAVRRRSSTSPNQSPMVISQRPTRSEKIGRYVAGQRELAIHQGLSEAAIQALPLQNGHLVLLESSSGHSETLQKLYHGVVSSAAIIRLKKSLAARRGNVSPPTTTPDDPLNAAAFHFRAASQLLTERTRSSLLILHHNFLFYLNLCGEDTRQSAEGWLHQDPQTLPMQAHARRGTKGGNPVNMSIARDMDNMLRRALPHWEHLSPEEREGERKEVDKRRKLGSRLAPFVEALGLGTLGLLPIRPAGELHDNLDVSDTEFSRLPKAELTRLIKALVAGGNLARFSHAATPMLEYIVGLKVHETRLFQCEGTPNETINSCLGGSDALLQQLEACSGDVGTTEMV